MSEIQTTYTGDLLLLQLEDGGSFDIQFNNGQPTMTNFIETTSIMYIFGEKWWGNRIQKSESSKMQSEFPALIRKNVISDEVVKNGVVAIKKALQPMIDEQIASEIIVSGEIISIYGIGWLVEIIAAIGNIKYAINWENYENSILAFSRVE